MESSLVARHREALVGALLLAGCGEPSPTPVEHATPSRLPPSQDAPSTHLPAQSRADRPTVKTTWTSADTSSLDERSRALAELARSQAASSDQPQAPEVADALGAWTRAELYWALETPEDDAVQLRVRREPFAPNQLWVLAFRAQPRRQPSAAATAKVFLLSAASGQLVREARGALEFPENVCVDLANPPAASTFELEWDKTSYRISEARVAIGVRLTCSISVPSSEGEESHLALLIRDTTALKQIFWLTTSAGSLDRVNRVETSEESTLSLLRTHHHAYNDLAVVTVRTRRTAPLDTATWQVLDTNKFQRRFIWDGMRYTPER